MPEYFYDEREHQAFDRYLQPKHKAWLPSSIKRRLIIVYRTIYTTFLCLLALYQYQWGNISTYLSPVLSSTSATLYLGEFLQTFTQVMYGTILGTLLGCGIAFTYRTPALLLFLLFLCLVFINSNSRITLSGKVNSNINLILVSLWPSTTAGDLIGTKALLNALPVPLIPYIITCFTLLFPIPALAIEAARSGADSICQELSSINIVLVRGFIAQDFHDLYDADFDNLYRRAEEELNAIQALVGHAKFELLFFPYLEDQVRALDRFHKLAVQLLHEFAGLRDILNLIKNNRTQSMFVEAMTVHLEDVAAEIAVAMRLISEEISNFDTPESNISMLPHRIYLKIKSIVTSEHHDADDDIGRRRKTSTNLGCSWLWDSSATLITRRKNELLRRKLHGMMHAAFDEPVPVIEEYIYCDTIDYHHVSVSSRKDSHVNASSKKDHHNRNPIDHHDSISSEGKRDYPLTLNPSIIDDKDGDHDYVKNSDKMERGGVSPPKYSPINSEYMYDSTKSTPSKPDTSAKQRQAARLQRFTDTMKRLSEAKKNLVDAFMATHNAFIGSQLDDNDTSTVEHHDDHNHNDHHHDDHHHQLSINIPKLRSIRRSTDKLTEESRMILDENQTIRNLNPRSAYVHRLSEIVIAMAGFDTLFVADETPYLYARLYDDFLHMFTNLYQTMVATMLVVSTSVHDMISTCKHNSITEAKDTWLPCLKPYVQPIKIASTIVLTSLLVVVPALANQPQGGLSAILIIAVVGREDTSSSFLVGYQRLEGTVIGAIYAFTTYQSFKCSSYENGCPSHITIPVLLFWLALCSFFKDGPRHGYASLVAGFTPIVLLIGPVSVTTDAAWIRVQKTFIGVAIYLIIDNLILPNRTSTSIRCGVLNALDETTNMFTEVIAGVMPLVDLGDKKSHPVGCDPFEQADLHLTQAHDHIESLNTVLNKQSNYLNLVVHDPVIWQRPFPINAYTNLLDCFQKLLRTGRDVERGSYAFARILREISVSQSPYTIAEPVNQQLYFYEFMSKRIFAVVTRANAALRMTSDALHRVYEHEELRTDLSPLLTISRYFDRLLREVDNKFQDLFLSPLGSTPRSNNQMMQPDGNMEMNPYYLLAWQNIFEALCALLNTISQLGTMLHRVRNIEAVNAT